jgi:hypothetical protein
MTRMVASLLLGAALCLLISSTRAEDAPAATYLLKYKFQPGETVRWKVMHRARVNTTVSGTTQTAETISESVKVWKMLPADAKGNFRFEHSVEKVEMKQKLTGREEIVYNSETDSEPPLGFEDAAKSVGVPLAIITIDPHGNVVHREQKRASASDSQGQVVIPLPSEPAPIGHSWSYPHDMQVPLRSGVVKQIKTRQKFTLEEVSNDLATISVETQVLTPVNDPEVEAQLIQREMAGKVKFDLKTGRIVSQQMDLDKSVVGFSGEASSLHYVMRFTEETISGAKVAGPAAMPGKPATARPATPAPRSAAKTRPAAPSRPARRR